MNIHTKRIACQIRFLLKETDGECTVRDMMRLTGASSMECINVCREHRWRFTSNATRQLSELAHKPRALGRDFIRAAGIEISGMVDA